MKKSKKITLGIIGICIIVVFIASFFKQDLCQTDKCYGKEFFICKEVDGRKQTVNSGLIIGKCGVECLEDDDCGEGLECRGGNKCLTDTGLDELREVVDEMREAYYGE